MTKNTYELAYMKANARFKKTYLSKNKVVRFLLGLIAVLTLLLVNFGCVFNVVATDLISSEKSTEQQLTETVDEQLQGIDFSEFQNILGKMSEEQQRIFGSTKFADKVTKLLTSDFSSNGTSFMGQVLSIIFDELLSFVPLLATICAIAILSSFISNLRVKSNDKSIADIVHFVCFGVIIVILSTSVLNFANMTRELLLSIQAQMELLFPIMLTLLAGLGGVVSVSVYQPLVAVLVSGVMQVFNYVVFPLFICTFVFTIVGNLSSTVKLNKFISFFKSAFKWTVGTVMTLFFTFLTIQGISAGSFDGVSVKTAKYAIKSYVPIVGGYLSDGFNLIMSSSILIKNAVGVAGLFLLFASIIIPIVKIAIFSLGMRLSSAIIEPISDSRISDFVYTVGKNMAFLVATILCVSFMYLISIALIICTGNAFY